MQKHNYRSSTMRISCDHLLFDDSEHLDIGGIWYPKNTQKKDTEQVVLLSTCTLLDLPESNFSLSL